MFFWGGFFVALVGLVGWFGDFVCVCVFVVVVVDWVGLFVCLFVSWGLFFHFGVWGGFVLFLVFLEFGVFLVCLFGEGFFFLL